MNSFLPRQAMASDVSLKHRTQQDSGVVLDVDKNWGKRGVPLGTPFFYNIKGLDNKC